MRISTNFLFAALALTAIVGVISFFAGSQLAAQDNSDTSEPLPKVEASRVGFIDLDAVLREDKELAKQLKTLKAQVATDEEAITKGFQTNFKNLGKETDKYRAGSEDWIKAFKERKKLSVAVVDEIAKNETKSIVDRDEYLYDAIERIDAMVEKVAKEKGLDTLIRIRLPLDEFSDSDRTKFRIKSESLVYSTPGHRDVTKEVIARLNKNFKDE